MKRVLFAAGIIMTALFSTATKAHASEPPTRQAPLLEDDDDDSDDSATVHWWDYWLQPF